VKKLEFEECKNILNGKVKDKYTDEQIKAIHAAIKLLVQIDLKRMKE
jgi:hypothetical protein